jgi:hypothetical protein
MSSGEIVEKGASWILGEHVLGAGHTPHWLAEVLAQHRGRANDLILLANSLLQIAASNASFYAGKSRLSGQEQSSIAKPLLKQISLCLAAKEQAMSVG